MLTKSMHRQIEHIEAFQRTNKRPPTMRELAQSQGIANHNAVWERNKRLVERGYLRIDQWSGEGTRSMVILRPLAAQVFVFDEEAKALVPFKCNQPARAERADDDEDGVVGLCRSAVLAGQWSVGRLV